MMCYPVRATSGNKLKLYRVYRSYSRVRCNDLLRYGIDHLLTFNHGVEGSSPSALTNNPTKTNAKSPRAQSVSVRVLSGGARLVGDLCPKRRRRATPVIAVKAATGPVDCTEPSQ